MIYDLIYYSIGDWGANVSQVNAAKHVANSMANYYYYLNPDRMSTNIVGMVGDADVNDIFLLLSFSISISIVIYFI